MRNCWRRRSPRWIGRAGPASRWSKTSSGPVDSIGGLKQSTCADPCEHLVCGLRYDKALIRLSLALGAETSPNRFVCPDAERARLEGQLASLGPCLHDFIESR